tara:strand:+ start:89 stop:349 length:261 start_codon:yes stop_codon:yes gene_type:complete
MKHQKNLIEKTSISEAASFWAYLIVQPQSPWSGSFGTTILPQHFRKLDDGVEKPESFWPQRCGIAALPSARSNVPSWPLVAIQRMK